MGEKVYVTENQKLKQSGIWNMDEFYKILYRWFEFQGYSFHEDMYKQVDDPSGSQVLEMRWTARSEVDTYIRRVIKMAFLITGFGSAELEKDGIKIKTNKGTIEIRLTAYLELDYNNEWTTGFKKNLRAIYDKYLIKKRIEDEHAKFYDQINKFTDEIRQFLYLNQY